MEVDAPCPDFEGTPHADVGLNADLRDPEPIRLIGSGPKPAAGTTHCHASSTPSDPCRKHSQRALRGEQRFKLAQEINKYVGMDAAKQGRHKT